MRGYISRDMTSQLENAHLDIAVRFHADITRQLPQVVSHIELEEHGLRLVRRVDYGEIVRMIARYIRETNTRSDVSLVLYSIGTPGMDDYTRLFPSDGYEMLNLQDMDNVMQLVQANSLTAVNGITQAVNSHGSYYLTAINLGELFGDGLGGLFIALYISTEKYNELVANIYFTLLVILIAAMVLALVCTLLISRSISKPIQKLCGFADEIGRGNFRRNEYAFRDRELIDLNKRMNETAHKLEISDEDQKLFFQNVSHELKTPLMSIKGYAEGIKYGIFSNEDEKHSASNIIIEESDRLNNLVADLLYISKIDSSQAESSDYISANLGGILEGCADKLRGVLINSRGSQQKNISINHPKRDIYIKCNEESLMRAFMNIIANCLRYAETAVYIIYKESGDKIIISIKDDGAGIDEQDLPNIFKRFYKGRCGKHGIGLSIAKAIIEQHDARIIAGNRTDASGAEFTLEFALK